MSFPRGIVRSSGLNRQVIDPDVYHDSEQAFIHAENAGLVLGPRAMLKASIRCNQLKWDGALCEFATTIEVRRDAIEDRIRNTLIHHLRREHRDLNAVATADRRWVTLRDIGG